MKTALRPYVSAAVCSTFLVIAVSGILLLFVEMDRVEELHGWVGVAFAVAGVIHIVINWRALVSHLRGRRVLVWAAALIAVLATMLLGAAIEERDIDDALESEAVEHVLER
jgi:hypothetical protein